MDKKTILRFLKKKVLLLDGATGTQLFSRGMPHDVCPEAWCLKNPEVIKSVHADYQQAGSDIIYAATFGANRLKLKQFGLTNVREINRKLTRLAREAVKNKTMIAGDIGSTGHFVQPFGDLGFEDATDIFKEQIRGLLEGGADLLVIETMMDIQEARAALIAARELTDKFIMVTMTFDKTGRTINGTDPRTALIILQSLGADAVGCNCSTGPKEMLESIRAMKPYATVALVAKPNAGLPKLIGQDTVFTMSAREFSALGKRLVAAGANIIGGCCGTGPAHIAQLRDRLKDVRPLLPVRRSLSALASARKSVIIERNKFFVIGEKINPSGKVLMQKELLKGNFSYLRSLALVQQQAGANFLDVNVGAVNVDENKTMEGAVEVLSVASDLALVIDSSHIKTIESALKIFPGRALVNSISLEDEKIKKLLPLARKFGAMFILLPLSGQGIPRSLSERKKIIKKIYSRARRFGFTKDDIIIDGLAMSMASNPDYGRTTLKTIEWASKSFKSSVVIGLSNISFGLPNRAMINAAFLALARKKGLNLAIADPAVLKAFPNQAAKKIRDPAALVKYFSQVKAQLEAKKPNKSASIESQIAKAVLDGDKDAVVSLVNSGLRQGKNAYQLIESTVIPAIIKVGDLFDKKEYFLPQLIASAQTVKKAFALLKPQIKKETFAKDNKSLIILATVKGDIHDIGKNIVSLILESNGFKVLDLGKDVSAAKIIAAAKNYRPSVIGLSALMTTTMLRMKEVIILAQKQGLKTKFMVGGAVVNATYARSIKATYAQNATEAVRVIRKLT
jgi:5-methyltetrahydrofolate--homocysteine methyltransferase